MVSLLHCYIVFYRINDQQCRNETISQHHNITTSQHHNITTSQHHNITTSQHHNIIMKSFLTIDEDLILHQPQTDFAEELFAIVDENRTYLEQWLPWVRGTKTVEDSLKFLKDARRFSEGGQQLHTLIIYKGKIVGLVGFNTIQKKHQKGEIGYWIAENMQGKGIVTKAVKCLIDYGFKHLNFNRIIIRVSTENFKSQQIPQRLGFVHEGTLRSELILNDEFIDIKVFGLLKSEYFTKNDAL